MINGSNGPESIEGRIITKYNMDQLLEQQAANQHTHRAHFSTSLVPMTRDQRLKNFEGTFI